MNTSSPVHTLGNALWFLFHWRQRGDRAADHGRGRKVESSTAWLSLKALSYTAWRVMTAQRLAFHIALLLAQTAAYWVTSEWAFCAVKECSPAFSSRWRVSDGHVIYYAPSEPSIVWD